MKRIALVIDAAYLLKSAQSLKIQIDFIKLKGLLEKETGGVIVEGHYFNITPNTEPGERFHNWLRCAAPFGPQFEVHEYSLKPMKVACNGCGCVNSRNVQKGVDVAIALKFLKLVHKFDTVILVGGDGDFKDALQAARELSGKEIVVAGFSGSVSPDLQMLANKVLWLDNSCQAYQRRCA